MTPDWSIGPIDHIGIAVESLEKAMPFYQKTLGLPLAEIEEVPDQMVRVAIFPTGEGRVELLEPTSPDSPIAKFIAKRGEGIHHIAFRTDDIGGQLKQAAGAGVRLIHETPFEGAANKLVAFLHPKSTRGVLTELCAVKPGAEPKH